MIEAKQPKAKPKAAAEEGRGRAAPAAAPAGRSRRRRRSSRCSRRRAARSRRPQPVQGAGRLRRPCRARSRPGRPTRSPRRGANPDCRARAIEARAGSRRPQHDRFCHELHPRHRRTAERRQVDAVQPAGRQAPRAGRRPARRDARPARGRRRGSAISRSPWSTPRASTKARPTASSAACWRRPRPRSTSADAVLFLIDARAGLTPIDRRSPTSCAAPASR